MFLVELIIITYNDKTAVTMGSQWPWEHCTRDRVTRNLKDGYHQKELVVPPVTTSNTGAAVAFVY